METFRETIVQNTMHSFQEMIGMSKTFIAVALSQVENIFI